MNSDCRDCCSCVVRNPAESNFRGGIHEVYISGIRGGQAFGQTSPTARPAMGRDGTVQDLGIDEIVSVGGVNAALSLPLIIVS
jgi:hypothetical protein